MADLIEEMSVTMVPLSKKRALDLIDTVIVPLSYKIRQDEVLKSYFPDKDSYLQHSIKMGHLALAMLFAPEKAQVLMSRMHQAHAQHAIPESVLTPFMSEFIQRYIAWVRMSKLVPDEERARLEEEAQAYLAQCQADYKDHLSGVETPDAEADDLDDGFAFFESEEVDQAIEDMHTSAAHKTQISAAEFMRSGELMQEQVDIIMDEFRELEDLFARYVRYEPAFVSAFQQHLKYLADTLFSTFEFEQMGYSLQQLIRLLDRVGQMDEGVQTLIFTLLEQLVLDLSGWARKLFVEQDAIDIHYLDAALLASIAQIEMMFGET